MNHLTASARVSRAINSGQSVGSQRTTIGAGGKEPPSPCGAQIAQTALQSIGMSTRDGWGPPMPSPDYALAVSLIFTKATNQAIILQEPPSHVCSTSILWASLAHDKRFEQVPMSEAAPGDIIIGSGWQQGAAGYAGIVVEHGRIISNSSQGVQDNSSLLELQRHHPEMAVFRYVGFRNYYRSKSLANVGFNPDEPRVPAGQTGGGQWTTGMASSTPVLSGRSNTLGPDRFDSPAVASTPSVGRSSAVGAGTRDQLIKARHELDQAYAKEVDDIKKTRGITEEERNAGLKSLEEKYENARNDLNKRITRIEQTAQDIAFAYGGKASDYYKDLDETNPKVQKLMDYLDRFESAGVKDTFLLELRHVQGLPPPPSTDPHVWRSAVSAAIGVLGEEGSPAEETAVEDAAAKAERAAQILKKNVETGAQRAAKTAEELAAENPGKVVQQERTLRDANGNKVVDPVTGEARRVDHAVIDRDANSAKTYETTGDNVDKRLQIRKEERIRKEGGTFVRDKGTGKLIPTEGVSEVRRQK